MGVRKGESMGATATVAETSTKSDRSTMTVALADLIQAECAAAEAYRQVLEAQRSLAAYPALKDICEHHVFVAELLMDLSYFEGTDIPHKRGLWRGWSGLVSEDSADMEALGLLRMLMAGEEYNLRMYERAIRTRPSSNVCRAISSRILDRQRQHFRDVYDIILMLSKKGHADNHLSSIYGYQVG